MKAGDRYPATVPDIDQRLVDQWRRHRYGVTVEQARDILQQLSNDPTLLQKCAQWKVNITHVIWDMTVASAWREILTQKIDDRRQTKDSLKKTEQRKPSDDVLDVPKLFRRRFVADYSIKTLNEQLARENAILSKYSAFPRMAGHAWRSDSQGRPADTPGQWILERVKAALAKSRAPIHVQDALCGRLLAHSGFLHASQIKDIESALVNAPDTLKRKSSRLKLTHQVPSTKNHKV